MTKRIVAVFSIISVLVIALLVMATVKPLYDEEEAIRRLLPQKLKDQYTFKTAEAISLLQCKEVISL